NSAYTMEELSKIENPTVTDVLALNQQVNDELLLTVEPPGMPVGSKSLQNAIIVSEPDFRTALSNLQRILQKLETLVNEGGPDLIGTNVTPEQITELQQKVDNLLNGITEDGKTESEEFAGIFAGLIQILPPQTQPKPQVTVNTEAQAQVVAAASPSD